MNFATEDTESTEEKKSEIRSTKSETISKTECSNDQNEKESRIARISRVLATKTRRHEEIRFWLDTDLHCFRISRKKAQEAQRRKRISGY